MLLFPLFQVIKCGGIPCLCWTMDFPRRSKGSPIILTQPCTWRRIRSWSLLRYLWSKHQEQDDIYHPSCRTDLLSLPSPFRAQTTGSGMNWSTQTWPRTPSHCLLSSLGCPPAQMPPSPGPTARSSSLRETSTGAWMSCWVSTKDTHWARRSAGCDVRHQPSGGSRRKEVYNRQSSFHSDGIDSQETSTAPTGFISLDFNPLFLPSAVGWCWWGCILEPFYDCQIYVSCWMISGRREGRPSVFLSHICWIMCF